MSPDLIGVLALEDESPLLLTGSCRIVVSRIRMNGMGSAATKETLVAGERGRMNTWLRPSLSQETRTKKAIVFSGYA